MTLRDRSAYSHHFHQRLKAYRFALRIELLEDRKVLSGCATAAGELLIGLEDPMALADPLASMGSSPSGDVTIQQGDWEVVAAPQGDEPYVVRWSLPEGVDAETMAAQLESQPGVIYAEPNYEVAIEVIPDDSQFNQLWGLHNTGQSGGTHDADIDAPSAWNLSVGSSEVVVGVIDTGVDYRHRDLYLNIWLNEEEIPSSIRSQLVDTDSDGLITFYDLNDSANSVWVSDLNGTGYIDGGDLLRPLAQGGWEDGFDTDGNGLADDFVGWDFVNDDNDPLDDNNHGTHVSGTIGAISDNNSGVTGVNWRVSIMGLKFLSASGSGFTSDAVAAVNYATNNGAHLTSNSWGGGGYSSSLRNAIANAANNGSLFVAAAGNSNLNTDNVPSYPASYNLSNIISVASTTRSDSRSSFSNYGAGSVDLGAPGSSIRSTVPNNGYATFSGTSMATPHVAGAAALAWSVAPSASYQEIRDAILNNVDLIPSMLGVTLSGGRLNVDQAVRSLGIGRDAQGPVISQVNVTATANRATITWTTDEASDSVVFLGLSPSNLNQTASVAGSTTSHSVVLTNLTPNTTYYLDVQSTDAMGNATRDAGGGAHYAFTTTGLAPILLVDDDEGDSLQSYFIDALDAGGYAHDVWDVNARGAAPTAADLAAYQAVVWNTGANYTSPTAGLTAAEQNAIGAYLDGGGAIFVAGQDILYNGVSAGFRTNYLHVAGYQNDVRVTGVTGVDGDPIAGGVGMAVNVPAAYELNYGDVLTPTADAEGVFLASQTVFNASYPYAAVRYGGAGEAPFKSVFFAFAFEGLSTSSADPNNQAAVMDRVIGWLLAPSEPGVTITPTSGLQTSESDGAGAATFTVALDTAPTAPVTFNLTTSDDTEGLLSTGGQAAASVSLTFTPNNWNPQTVAIVGQDDSNVDGDINYNIIISPASSADSRYDGFDPEDVSVTNLDNDASTSFQFDTGVVENVGSGGWTTVQLANTYSSMVVVAVPNYDIGDGPGVVRIQNAQGNSFQVRVDPARSSAGGAPLAGVNVQYLVVEEGVYTEQEHGVTMEAVKFNSTVTDNRRFWSGESRSYQNSYSQPVVLGQVMSYNDPDWSVFWSRSASSRGSAPNSAGFRVGKHVGEDSDTTRAAETIGYVVIEAGAGQLGGAGYVAGLGGDTIRGVGDSPPYAYSLNGLSSAKTAVVSQAAMDGSNGGWAVLYGDQPVTPNQLQLAIDEDQERDSERRHTTEQVAFIVFEGAGSSGWVSESFAEPPHEPPSLNIAIVGVLPPTPASVADPVGRNVNERNRIETALPGDSYFATENDFNRTSFDDVDSLTDSTWPLAAQGARPSPQSATEPTVDAVFSEMSGEFSEPFDKWRRLRPMA